MSMSTTIDAKRPPTIEELPEVLTPQQIADYLNMSRRRVYDLLQLNPVHGGITNFDLGSTKQASKRVMKSDFIKWMETRKKDKASRFAT